MARYIDVEGYRKLFDEEYKETRKLISEGETHLDNLAEGFSEASRVLDRMPTADVVPRADVIVLETTVKTLQDFLQAEKKHTAKVAREIITDLAYNKKLFTLPSWAIEELIKKYTEGL